MRSPTAAPRAKVARPPARQQARSAAPRLPGRRLRLLGRSASFSSVPRDRKWIVIKLFACAVVAALILVGLAPLHRSTNHFLVHEGDSRVHYERGAEVAAAAIVRALPPAIATVERAQFLPFAKPVNIFVC